MEVAEPRLEVESGEDEPSITKDSWAAVLVDNDSGQESQDEEMGAPYRVELQRYLKEKRIADLTKDPLTYWRVKHNEFPHLRTLARRYHCPPPGSAASERLFSAGKNVLGTTRLSRKPDNMEANLFLKYNIRALGYKTDLARVTDDFVCTQRGEPARGNDGRGPF